MNPISNLTILSKIKVLEFFSIPLPKSNLHPLPVVKPLPKSNNCRFRIYIGLLTNLACLKKLLLKKDKISYQ